MQNLSLHRHIHEILSTYPQLDLEGKDNLFYTKLVTNTAAIYNFYDEVYGNHPEAEKHFDGLVRIITNAHLARPVHLQDRDFNKEMKDHWFLSNQITGMSLYVDRFCGNLSNLESRLDYFKKLGVNFLHLMPIFESPEGESDGGYAVSDFRKIDPRFGTIEELRSLQQKMQTENMYLMLDIVLNHTSHHHAWADRAKKGEQQYQDYYFMTRDKQTVDRFEAGMPEIFPDSSPGNFTYLPETGQWVMTVFHHYQWDLNYTNPAVFLEMIDNIFFYANLGVDLLRIDAPAFIWKEPGTSCQNLPGAHTLLRLIKQCVQVSTPGMALLAEAIVAPNEIMKYFGTGIYTARECDFAYNATHMALQWDALATGDTRIMLNAQYEILQKPFGTSWITYTRCHDDIGLGYDDYTIHQAGFDPVQHREFLKNYYSGNFPGSPATGALFSVNPRTNDARISGSLASLCGLEKAMQSDDKASIDLSIRKILLMQAHSFFLGGIPVIFYGDEAAYTNDYSYLNDPARAYDNRWMHRPVIDWQRNQRIDIIGTVEEQVFSGTKKLIALRTKLDMTSDYKNLTWLTPHNIHVAGYLRAIDNKKLYCLFNFSGTDAYVTWFIFKEHGPAPEKLFDHWGNRSYRTGEDWEHLIIPPYGFVLLEVEG